MSFQYEMHTSNTPKIVMIAVIGVVFVTLWGSLLSVLS